MDSSSYLLELAHKFQISSFDASDLSHLSSGDSSSAGASADVSSDEISTDLQEHGSRPGAAAAGRRNQPISAASALRSSPTAASSSSSHAASTKSAERYNELKMKYEQLKKNHRKQGEELERTTKLFDEFKHTSSRERAELEDRIQSLEHQHSLLESSHQKAMLEYNHSLQTKQSELQQVTQTLRTVQSQMADSNPDIQKQIEYVKDDLTDLYISESLYLEYNGIDSSRQTIREYVCCQVYELMRTEKQARESMQKELELIRNKWIKSEDEAERNARERDQIAKVKRSREAELSSELSHLESLNAKYQEELTKKTIQINELITKGELYDALAKNAAKLEEDLLALQQKDLISTLTLRSLTEEKESMSQRLLHHEKEKDLLRQDKMYLTKEVDRLTECYRNSEKDKDRADQKNNDLKRQKEDLVEKLVKVREEHQSAYEEKLNAELQRLQLRTTNDLDSIRTNQRDAYEREIAGLKEARETWMKEHEKLRTSADATKADLTHLQEEHRKLQSQIECERTDTRNALKLKAFEYERLSLTYEESMSDFRKIKIEHEVLAKKQSVLKNEFYTLQGESQKTILALESECKNLKEKLEMYHQLEYELDMAILNAGGVEDVQDKSSLSSGHIRGIHHMLESLGTNIPTANKRRMKQSILLAQQLVEKQKQIEMIQAELQFVKEKYGETDTELQAAKSSLSFVSQPQNYLISALQQKEQELIAANKRLTEMKKTMEQQERECARVNERSRQVEADLQRLLAGSSQLDQLKDALVRGHYSQHVAAHASTQPHSSSLPSRSHSFKENIRPTSAHSNGGVEERSFMSLSPNDPKQRFQHLATAASQPPTSRQHQQARSHSQSPALNDDQPKPMWFSKLTQ